MASEPSPRFPHLPALDGLRALSVLAVVLWHIHILSGEGIQPVVGQFVGGYLGVEVFFVISGYLITSLLLIEFRGSGGLGLRRFYVRRARRLLPALLVLLGVVVAYMALFVPDQLATIQGDVLAALAYVTNWFLIFDESVYGAKAPLDHLWSLAVEEQYYLLWPIVLLVGLRLVGRRRFVVATVGFALLAAVGTAVVFWTSKTSLGTLRFLDDDVTPLYVNSITRSSGLLLGSALAFGWSPLRLTAKIARPARHALDGAGLAAALALAWMFVTLDYNGEAARTFLYGAGGFVVVDVLTLVLIATVVHPASRLRAVIGVRPLELVGQRSYGIYLWQGPVIAFTEPGVDVALTGVANTALRLVLIGVLSELSFRFVEQPIRGGVIGRTLARLRGTSGPVRERLAVRFYGTVAACTVVALGLVAVLSSAPAPDDLAFVGAGAAGDATIPTVVQGGTAATGAAGARGGEPSPTTQPSARGSTTTSGPARTSSSTRQEGTTPTTAARATAPTTAGSTTTAPAPPPTAPPVAAADTVSSRPVTLIGDSVMLGASNYGGIQDAVPGMLRIDATVSRQAVDGVQRIAELEAAGALGNVVVVHLGTNGTFRSDLFDQMMEIVGPQRHVVAVNARVPRSWEADVNATLAAAVARHPNASLVDWHAAGNARPDLFAADGFHLTDAGADYYAGLIRERVLAVPVG